jgi:hypothetical protein
MVKNKDWEVVLRKDLPKTQGRQAYIQYLGMQEEE